MASNIHRSILTLILFSGVAVGQTSLILKTRRVMTDPAQLVNEAQGSNASGSGHLLIQFNAPVTNRDLNELKARGVTILADVPEDGLLVSVPGPVVLKGLGIRYASPMLASDKVSKLVPANRTGHLLVEFYPDVDLGDARALLSNEGAVVKDHPDLGPHVLMIQTQDAALVRSLAAQDAVSYIFPASEDLVKGRPLRPCEGALTSNGSTVQSIPTYGNGWDGPGLGAATVFYYYTNTTEQLNAAAAKAQIALAMAQWAKVVQVKWAPGSSPTGNQTVNIFWATYAHGDAYPFTGPGGVIAHTFYPAPPNVEPVAGDMHLNDSETWNIGSDIDLFSVTLHELGHALGLGHSDNPDDVMYPYYKMVTGLSAGDIGAIQTLYAAVPNAAAPVPTTPTTTPAPAVPLTLTVNATASTTTASTVNLTGTAAGGSGTITVTWSTASSTIAVSGTASGTAAAWTITGIPLSVGTNTITVTATAGASHTSQVVTITEQAATTVTTPPVTTPTTTSGSTDTTPPTLTISSPGATSVSTSSATIAFSGTASDNVGVTSVKWSTNTGTSGTANGTTSWSVASIPLLVGSNVVTIRAYDAAGNSGWRSVVVTRQ